MIIMAVDLGKARTGLAVCDEGERLASPAGVVNEHGRERLCNEICRIAAERAVKLFVVGLPRNMDGSEGESAQNAREFAEMLAQRSGIPTEMCDERGTTITAHHYLSENNVRGKKRKSTVDAVAATIILEDYLTLRRNRGIQP